MSSPRLALTLLAMSCEAASLAPGEAQRFLEDQAFRRARLEASLVDPQNGYSALRLERYAVEGAMGWDALEVYDPPVAPLVLKAAGPAAQGPFEPLSPLAQSLDEADLIELGRRAFERYPLSPAPELSLGEGYGLWVDDRGWLGGLVKVEEPGGSYVAKSCATCHARAEDRGPLIPGASNTTLDLGRARADLGIERSRAWGPGHVDPTPDGLDNPTGITDLRPIRYQSHLNVAATIKNDPIALAIRVETLMITSLGQAKRPPRILALAIAYFLWSLGEPEGQPAIDSRGAKVFERTCNGCHHLDFSTEAPVPLEVVGTDPLAGRSPMRGTGRYRIPSLFKVADRRRLLHLGQTQSLMQLLDPGRPAVGHPFGFGLSDEDKRALIELLGTLR